MARGQTALTKCTVPVYAAGILGAFGEVTVATALTFFCLTFIVYAVRVSRCCHEVSLTWVLYVSVVLRQYHLIHHVSAT